MAALLPDGTDQLRLAHLGATFDVQPRTAGHAEDLQVVYSWRGPPTTCRRRVDEKSSG